MNEHLERLLASAIESGRFTATGSFDVVAQADAVLICVPTPITDGAPDLSAVTSSAASITKHLERL